MINMTENELSRIVFDAALRVHQNFNVKLVKDGIKRIANNL